ncbi:DUF547 domain-containing protein [Hymenobacter sp. DG25B]|uniref:DUF547 domain-containing protein n=1 Tax=Hymenobacter sp. DG25B TaxID=1385664 RepID=UPI0006620807|nr:DUF547 domain-containing protein [Hymenobacter sp. DG25B]
MVFPSRLLPALLGWLVLCMLSTNTLAADGPAQVHQLWNELLFKHVTPDGRVDYQGFLDEEEKLAEYLQVLAQTTPNEQTWTRDDVKAFWLNAYNATTVSLVLEYYPVSSLNTVRVKSANGFSLWEAPTVMAAGHEYSLNQVERTQLRDRFQDPRIHFALVSGAVSSPVLRNEAYEGRRLHAQLEEQTQRFLLDPLLNTITPEHAQLSSLFDWYSAEFGPDTTALIGFINRYLRTPLAATAQVDFLPFDWRLNDRQALSGTQALTR